METNQIRTPQHFVEDLLSESKNFKHILTVAKNTYWKTRIEEVKQAFLTFSGKLSKKFDIF